MKRHLFAALLLFLASSPLLAAEDSEQLKSLKRAAEAGDVGAQYEIGVLYEFGYRMKTHLIPALAWYMVAADNGDARAIKRRDALMSQLKPDQVEEAKRIRAGIGAAKPAPSMPTEDKPADEPAKPAEDKPVVEPPKPAPVPEKPKPEAAPASEPPPAKPAEEKPTPVPAARPAAKPAEPKPEPKPEAAPPGDDPAVQPLLPPPPGE